MLRQTRSAGELTVAAVGLLVGLLVSALLWFPVHTLPYIGNWVILPLFLVVGYLFAYVAAKKHRGILRLVGVHQLVDPSMPGSSNASVETLVDTSAIIDGRIADIVRTGFLRGELVVPEFVLRELQQVADSGDPLKRARGRRGLEVVQGLRSEVTVATPEIDFPELADVDAKLLKLAKQRGLRILTTDYNLNRLARIQDVVVLNVNELANALKPAVLPGERLEIRLIREGKEADQGVGYLDDGTMVVVEGGRRRVGDTVDVQVTSVLQSPSGKMIFTRIGEPGANDGRAGVGGRGRGRRRPPSRPRAPEGVREAGRPAAPGARDRAVRGPSARRADRRRRAGGVGGADGASRRRARRRARWRRRSRADRRGRSRSQPASTRSPTTATAVLVHDAARPFASEALVDRVLDALEGADGAVPAIPVSDTVKRVHDGVGRRDARRGRSCARSRRRRRSGPRRCGGPTPARPTTSQARPTARSSSSARAAAWWWSRARPANVKITDADDLARAEAAVKGAA